MVESICRQVIVYKKNCLRKGSTHCLICWSWCILAPPGLFAKPTLDVIEVNMTKVDDCLEAILELWLCKVDNTSPSWSMLLAAVCNPVGGDNPALADRIAAEHNGTLYM